MQIYHTDLHDILERRVYRTRSIAIVFLSSPVSEEWIIVYQGHSFAVKAVFMRPGELMIIIDHLIFSLFCLILSDVVY